MEQAKTRSRTERHQNAKPKSSNSNKTKKNKPVSLHRSAMFFLGVAAISLIVGGMVGLIVGGQSPLQVFNPNTWTHMLKLIFSA